MGAAPLRPRRPEKALEPGAPLSNPEDNPEGNLDTRGLYIEGHGDVEKGFAEADKIIEFKYTMGLEHLGRPGAALRGLAMERRVRRGLGQAAAAAHLQAGHLHLVRRPPHEQDRPPLPLPGRQLRRLEPDGLEPGRHLLRGRGGQAHRPAGQVALQPAGGLLRRRDGRRGLLLQGGSQAGRHHHRGGGTGSGGQPGHARVRHRQAPHGQHQDPPRATA